MWRGSWHPTLGIASFVEQQKELAALQAVRDALEEALGMKFSADKGEHFFRSTLVQTLFYGIFSAWVRWHKENPGATGEVRLARAKWSLYVPFVGTLYESGGTPISLASSGWWKCSIGLPAC